MSVILDTPLKQKLKLHLVQENKRSHSGKLLQFSGTYHKPRGIQHNADKMSREQMERGCGLCLNMVPMYAPPT